MVAVTTSAKSALSRAMRWMGTLQIAKHHMSRFTNHGNHNMEVIRVTKAICKEIATERHYSRGIGIFWEGYALIEDGNITGICVYGQPAAMIQKHAFSDKDFRLYELTRLVVWSEDKNARSFLISKSLNMLSVKPSAVISYADSNQGHVGIVYQATNWIYTGAPVACGKNVIIDGKLYHPQTLADMGIKKQHKWAKEMGYEMVPQKPKHRYFYLLGSKREKRNMLKRLNYDVVADYPKGKKTMYETSTECVNMLDEYVKGEKPSQFSLDL